MAHSALGFHTYAGGHLTGVLQAGFNVPATLEPGAFGQATVAANHGDVEWAKPSRASEYLGVEWVFSNPPCAPWSQAGKSMSGGRDSWRSDPRVEYTRESFGLIEKLRPTVWSWESVFRTYQTGKDLVDELSTQALRMGYAVTHLLTDGQMHGLPQRRRRFFMIAHRVAIPFASPSLKRVTVREALAGVEPDWYQPINEAWRHAAEHCLEGMYLRHTWETVEGVTGKQRIRNRPPYTMHRIRWDDVCSTLTSMKSQLHPSEQRFLANSEVSALMGYPRNYQWVGEPRDLQTQMCQAVSPVAARYLADAVWRGLDMGMPATPVVRVVDHLTRYPVDNTPLRRVF